jgi:hypothetical protein
VDRGDDRLAELISAELLEPVSPGAQHLADEVRRLCGGAPVAAVVFYGSCLRRDSDEGVLDFYAIVDDYRPASRTRALAWANAALPPNVYYLELDGPQGRLRSKYAVVSRRDLARGVSPRTLRPSLWARFCQPVRAIYVRDDAARQALVDAITSSLLTLLQRIVPLMPDAPFRLGDLWQHAFFETYRYEMRTEAPETIQQLYISSAGRFAEAARRGLALWAQTGAVKVESIGEDTVRVHMDPAARRRAQRAWRWRRPLAKAVYLAGLFKSAFTFGDWLPYALWKLERHTGTRIELTERQRRRPLVWGWPVVFRVFRQRDLR